MELISTLLCLALIFGYVTGNIAIITLVTSRIKGQSKRIRYALKIIGACLCLIFVNLPPLFYAYDPTVFDHLAGSSRVRLAAISALLLCWLSVLVLTGWIGVLRDWSLRCKIMRKRG